MRRVIGLLLTMVVLSSCAEMRPKVSEQIRDSLPDEAIAAKTAIPCLLYTSPSPRDQRGSRMPSSA